MVRGVTHVSAVPTQGRKDARRPPARVRSVPERPPAIVLALGLFLAARLLGVAVVAALARSAGRDPFDVLARSWDSRWYLGIAENGYGIVRHTWFGVANDLAFFPLYPGLVRAVTEIVPLSSGAAGLLVSWTAAGVAACGLYAIGALLYGRGVGVVLVVLWGVLPHSVVLSLAYTESLLTAFAAWSLYAVLTGRWVWAGALAALAGASRPNGMAVTAAVLVAAACEVVRRRGRDVPRRLWAGAALAPLGWCGYVLWVGVRTGDPLGGYFAVQRGWGSKFDFGTSAVRFAGEKLLHGGRYTYAMAMVIVLVSVVLLVLLALDRPPGALLVYAGVLLLIAIGGSSFFACKPRFLLPAFPLLLPVARALVRTARARPWHATVVVAALAGLSVFYGAFLVVHGRTSL